LASSNYKDASPTGLKNRQQRHMKKIPLKNQKRNRRPSRKPRLSLYDRTKDLCGSVSGLSDLSTRKLIGYGLAAIELSADFLF